MTAKLDQRTAIAYRALRRRGSLGATMTEYALLLVAVLIVATAVFKNLKTSTDCNGMMSVGELPGSEAGTTDCGGGGAMASTAGASDLGGSVNNYGGSSGDAVGATGSGASGDSAGSAGGSAGNSGSSSGSATGSDDGSGSVASSSSGYPGVTTAANGVDPHTGPSFASQVAGTQPQAFDHAAADLSQNVYDAPVAPKSRDGIAAIDGFVPLTQDELHKAGIEPSDLQDPSTGFKANIYKDSNGDYVIAFQGSVNGKDARTDVLQGLGYPAKAYREANRLAAKAKAAYGNNLVAVGHSLGGGEAAAVAAHYGIPAVTQNAAGVNDNTLLYEGRYPPAARADAANGQVRNYYLEGEVLNTSQQYTSMVSAQAMGTQIEVKDVHRSDLSRAVGLESPSTFFNNHKIGTFQDSYKSSNGALSVKPW